MNFAFSYILRIGRSTAMFLLLSLIVGFSIVISFPIISDAQSPLKTFVTHSGSVIKTSGEVIDPLYAVSIV